LKLSLPKISRRHEPVPLDQPSGIVGLMEFEQCLPQFLDRLEVPATIDQATRSQRPAPGLPDE
jgi:hypothetical protein